MGEKLKKLMIIFSLTALPGCGTFTIVRVYNNSVEHGPKVKYQHNPYKFREIWRSYQ